MSRIEELAEKRAAMLSQMEALEEEHRIREFNLAKGQIERHLRTLDQEAQGLGFKFRHGTHTDCTACLSRMLRVRIIA